MVNYVSKYISYVMQNMFESGVVLKMLNKLQTFFPRVFVEKNVKMYVK